MKREDRVKTVAFPLFAAMLWGGCFVGQRIAAQNMEPFAFNSIRSLLASFLLLAFVYLTRKRQKELPTSRKEWRFIILGGVLAGVLLFMAQNFQQIGMEDMETGKAGFLTALYIVLVPIFSTVLGKKVSLFTWIGIVLALVGMYFLCITGSFTIRRSDLLMIFCAIIYGVYILIVDYYVKRTNAILFNGIHFASAAVCSAFVSLFAEHPATWNLRPCIGPILYAAIFSNAIAYGLQMIAQKEGNSVRVAVLFSLESVFSLLFGAVLLNEILTPREFLGCGIMFAAVILAQLPENFFKKKVKV